MKACSPARRRLQGVRPVKRQCTRGRLPDVAAPRSRPWHRRFFPRPTPRDERLHHRLDSLAQPPGPPACRKPDVVRMRAGRCRLAARWNLKNHLICLPKGVGAATSTCATRGDQLLSLTMAGTSAAKPYYWTTHETAPDLCGSSARAASDPAVRRREARHEACGCANILRNLHKARTRSVFLSYFLASRRPCLLGRTSDITEHVGLLPCHRSRSGPRA